LPDAREHRYDPAERVALATLKLVAAYAMGMVRGDRSRHKVVLFDEAWFLLGTPDGRRLLDRLNRMGRAENATLLLATQQLGDVGDLETLVGTRMVFRQETRAEAKRALVLLGLDPDDDRLADRLVAMPAGQCLYQDLERRTAEVRVDTVYPWLLDALDTTPGVREAVAV
jgi:DNA helicase HerA-like ATPase